MADPLYTFIDSTGVIVPDTADIKAEVQAEWRDALGADLDVTDSTPQGVLIAAETEARKSVAVNNATVANQINPNMAGGVFLDALCALTGLERSAASKSVVDGVEVAGVPGTIIPAGSVAKTAGGDQFATAGAVTIPAGGSTVVSFIAVETGAVPCAAGELTQIVSAVLGWETVTNPTAAVLGTTEQTDQDLRGKRRRTLALQGVSVAEAITSGLYDVPGVTSLQYRENHTKVDATIDGIFLLANSVWACVRGGTDGDVAAALLSNKSGGCAWNGSTTVNVVEPASGQTYAVKFDRPAEVPIKARITVKANAALTDAQTSVRSAVMAWVAMADDGLPGLRTGRDVSPFEMAASVNSSTPDIYVAKVELTTIAADTWAVSEIPIALDEIATLSEGSITVVQL